jgi:hypothetical protein
MQQHTVVITFDVAGNPVPLSADGSRIDTTRKTHGGDQIRWVSPHGAVAVTFHQPTPFQDGPNGDETFRALSAQGSFTYRCTVTTQDGKRHGWPDNQNGGGTVEVGG